MNLFNLEKMHLENASNKTIMTVADAVISIDTKEKLTTIKEMIEAVMKNYEDATKQQKGRIAATFWYHWAKEAK